MNKKIFQLKIQLTAAVLLLLVTLISGFFIFGPELSQIAKALTGDYSKSEGSELSHSDWNTLRADFVAKSGGADAVMTGPLTLPGDPTADLQAATKQYVDKSGDIFFNWGRSDCPSGTTLLYNGYTFGSKWNEPYGSGEILCIRSGSAGPPNSSSVRDKLWPVAIGEAEYTPPGMVSGTAIKCASCFRPGGICYEAIGSNICATGFSAVYNGYIMGGVTGLDNPNNKNINERSCINSNYDGTQPVPDFSAISVYAGTVIVDNSVLSAYTTDAYIRCSVCCN